MTMNILRIIVFGNDHIAVDKVTAPLHGNMFNGGMPAFMTAGIGRNVKGNPSLCPGSFSPPKNIQILNLLFWYIIDNSQDFQL